MRSAGGKDSVVAQLRICVSEPEPPVHRFESRLRTPSLEDRDLMAEGEDLHLEVAAGLDIGAK